jgi:hypothetical protein
MKYRTLLICIICAISLIGCSKDDININEPGNPDNPGDGGSTATIQLAYTEFGVLSQLFQYDEQERVVRALYFTDKGILSSFADYSYLGNNRYPSIEKWRLGSAHNIPWFISVIGHLSFNASDGFSPIWSFEYEYTEKNQLRSRTHTYTTGGQFITEYEYENQDCALHQVTAYQVGVNEPHEQYNFVRSYHYDDDHCSYATQTDNGHEEVRVYDAFNSPYKNMNIREDELMGFNHNPLQIKDSENGSIVVDETYVYEYNENNFPLSRRSADQELTTYHYVNESNAPQVNIVETENIARLISTKVLVTMKDIINELPEDQSYYNLIFYSDSSLVVNGYRSYTEETTTTSTNQYYNERDISDVDLLLHDYTSPDGELRIYKGTVSYYENDYERTNLHIPTGIQDTDQSHTWSYEAQIFIIYTFNGKEYQDFLLIDYERDEENYSNPSITIHSTASQQVFEIN